MMQYVTRFLFSVVVAALPAYALFVERGCVWVAIVWFLLVIIIFGILVVVMKVVRMQDVSNRSSDASAVAALILEFFPSVLGVVGYIAIFSMEMNFANAVYFGVLLLFPVMIVDILTLKMYAQEGLLSENIELLHRRVQAIAKGEEFDFGSETKKSVARLNSVYVVALGRGWFPIGYFVVKYSCMVVGAWIIYKTLS